MFEVKGKHNSCRVYTDIVDNETISQLTNMMNQECLTGSNVAIMPDCHAGKGAVIGTTMTIKNKVIPNLVGVDIGCGMRVIKLEERSVDLPNLDSVIKKNVSMVYHDRAIASSNVDGLRTKSADVERAMKSLGTLGGGNHFIELDKGDDGSLYLVIHTGSRHLGLEVCGYYQKLAYDLLKDKAFGGSLKDRTKAEIERLKKAGREKECSKAIKELKKEYENAMAKVPFELAYLEGQAFDDYIHDMRLTQEHASINRATIAKLILGHAKLHAVEEFETVHNYIDIKNMILRKGAVSAKEGEKLIIPMNMRDGSLICIGKGNPEWNCSAPHGAGRIMSRGQAKESVSMDEYRKSMEGIYTTCVNRSTVDESPMAYKPMEAIVENIADTVNIVEHIVPIYNFKASEDE